MASDLPPKIVQEQYTVINDRINPLDDPRYSLRIYTSLDSNDDLLLLERYFRNLDNISLNKEFELPNGHRFSISRRGVINYRRAGIDEERKVSFNNKSFLPSLSHGQKGWKILTATLLFDEIAKIFSHLAQNKSYSRKKDHDPNHQHDLRVEKVLGSG